MNAGLCAQPRRRFASGCDLRVLGHATPIALPGEGALAAAVNPTSGDALYFVATGEGGHAFSATLEEHNRAVRRYQLKAK